jgi:hypothetical protein
LDIKISNISQKIEVLKTPFSIFYRVFIEDQNFFLKETRTDAWNASKIIGSYENYKKIDNVEDIVKIYDFAFLDNKILLLMEELEGYENLIKVIVSDEQYKDVIIKQVLDLFEFMWNRGFINYDFTIINFMVKDAKLKMIDVEFIERIEQMNLNRVLWFCERLDIIQNWYGKQNDIFSNIKKRVVLKWSEVKLL